MDKNQLKKLILTSRGIIPADLVIKNCSIVNVYTHKIEKGDIAVSDGLIAGTGSYKGLSETDASGLFAVPGLIESHLHVECTFLTPEELGRMLVPLGTTTVISDPHEIANVKGIEGLDYMLEAAGRTVLDIKYMIPSCVPCTSFENSGAEINAETVGKLLETGNFSGIAEFMDFEGIFNGNEECLAKLEAAWKNGSIIDGHAPGVTGRDRQAYAAAGIHTDHECSTWEEMEDSIRCGMYVELRDGSACRDLENLLPYVTEANSRRCLLCSDERLPSTILKEGDLDHHLRLCVKHGIDAITAIQMATLNAAECYGLKDRGAIAPGLRADIVLMQDLKDFRAEKVYIQGKLAAENNVYLPEIKKAPVEKVLGNINTGSFSKDSLKLKLKKNTVHVIKVNSGSLVTENVIEEVKTDSENCFCFDSQKDIVKLAVIERHHGKGTCGLGLLENYGLSRGAIALTVAHDSHNIICTGTSDSDMYAAVEELKKMEGGIVLVLDGKVLSSLPLPAAGLMSTEDGKTVAAKMNEISEKAVKLLGVNKALEPIGTLCFMSLPVIGDLKVTDKGLFDVKKNCFISIEE